MSEPIVRVVVRRIRSLLNQKSEILVSVKDKIEELLSKIEILTKYLEHADEDRLLTETANKYENKFENSIYKVTSERRGSYSFLRRFLMKITHESEDVIDNIVNKAGRHGFLQKYVCQPCFQIGIREIDSIIDKLDEAIEDIKKFNVLEELEPKVKSEDQRLRSSNTTQKPPPTTSHPHKLIGLEKNINSLVEKIVQKEYTVRIFYIVGTVGSGRTTLATELSNHPEIKEHFRSVVWVSVSEKKDAKNIFLEILRNIQGKDEGVNSSMITDQLVNKICNILKERSYLIILDDVEDPDSLAIHLSPMTKHLSYKCKLVITTHATPSNPYKHLEYTVSSSETADSLAEKLTAKKTRESSIFYMLAKPDTDLLKWLLKRFYEDSRVNEHFDIKEWVSIEDGRDNQRILLDIKHKVMTSTNHSKEKVATDSEDGNDSPDNASNKKSKGSPAKKANLIVLNHVQKEESLECLLHPILEDTEHINKVIIITNNPPTELQQKELITDEDLLDVNYLLQKIAGEGEEPSLFCIRDLDGSGGNKNLANELYKHYIVKQHFEAKFWITIPKEGNAESALCHIIKEITGSNPNIQESSTKKLADVLLGALREKKCLIVLYDLGDAEDLVCDLIAAHSSTNIHKNFLQSKIIITIGNPRIFRVWDFRYFLYEMQPLPKKESWDLLCSIASNNAKSKPKIEQVIGQINRKTNGDLIKIVKKLEYCNGIPLAIVALGGLLSTKETVEEWERVSTSLGSEETRSNQVLENILHLSYHDIPSEIKPCFLYFGFFPKHSKISIGMLIRMWISEGLVTLDSSPDSQQTLEKVAAQYLEELVCRCLIQVVRRNHIGDIKTILLNDKIHQVSITKSRELGFLENYSHTQDKPLLQAATHYRGDVPQIREMLLRRVAIHPGKFNKYPTQSSKLRTLVQFGKHGLSAKDYYFQHDALFTNLGPIHKQFKLLRVLILCGNRIRDLPKHVGELTFLTYLGLRATGVLALPETIGKLRQLITLDYVGTLKPIDCNQLPNVLGNMTKLRHVYLPQYALPSMEKLDLSTLQNLQILWGVSGGKWLTVDFGKLSACLIKLGIVKISCTKELEAVVNWLNQDPKGPKKLQVLKLDWHSAREDKLLFPESLHGFQHLHKLAFIGRLKEEYNFTLLTSLVKLELYFSQLEEYDPTEKLGHLPLLKILHLWNSYKGTQWNCGSNMFLKLEELLISHLPNLVKWRIEPGAMPDLKRLSISSCRKLLELPKGLRYINLQRLDIQEMSVSFSNRLHEIKDETTAEAKETSTI